MRGAPWTMAGRELLAELWAQGLSAAQIAERLGRSRGAVCRMADRLDLNEKKPAFFSIIRMNQVIYFKLPLRNGTEKLLRRVDKLVEWVDEGRDNYELARAFHVPIGDVAYVINRLGLYRPYEVEEAPAEDAELRSCSACGSQFEATRYRFRCDACLHAAAGVHDCKIN